MVNIYRVDYNKDKYNGFKAILLIYGELLLYIFYTAYFIKLGNWARYSTIALIV